jgi:hypothetical protein
MSTPPLIAVASGEGARRSALGARRSALGALVRTFLPVSLGLLLLTAAGLKGYELLATPLPEASLWSWRAFRIGAVEAEGVLGLWLLSGLRRHGARRVALAGFGLFFSVSLSKALAGEENCGCFGRVPLDPRWTAALDLAAILALWRWHPAKRMERGKGGRRMGLAAVLLLIAFVGVSGGLVLASGRFAVLDGETDLDANASLVVLEPEKWMGRRCPLLSYADIGAELSQGRWLVVLYHHDCPRCRAGIPIYEAKGRSAASDPAAPRIAFLAVPPHGTPLWQFAPGLACRQGKLTESKEWFVATPAVVRLQDGVVQETPALP